MTCGCCGSAPGECTCYEFPGWGSVRHINLDRAAPPVPVGERLGTWKATALCGNDITSSCLYVSALAALYAGPMAPLALLLVAGVLYLFRWVYAEVGSALPLNGGAYNLILNSSRKSFAAGAAALTVLSYMATGVISASEAMHYAERLVVGLPVVPATMALLAGFAILAILGLSESAVVAVVIFCAHMTTLVGLSLLGLLALATDSSILWANLTLPPSQWPTPTDSITVALFFGFAAGMLGISGFESSANFIEEQKDGVFPKTLRNMWLAVAVFNPLIALLAVGLLPLGDVAGDKEALLATMAARAPQVLGMDWLSGPAAFWVSVDAVVVLCGAVLTSFVGVTGLIRRMALDLILPSRLLDKNPRGSNHWIILSFLALCISVLVITRGRLEALAAVYTLSFLSVMVLFAGGNLLLKWRRPQLHRPIRAHSAVVVLALVSVLVALGGNVLLDPGGVGVFAGYAGVAALVVLLGYARNTLLASVLKPLSGLLPRPIEQTAQRWLHEHACQRLLYVTHSEDRAEIAEAAAYVLRNEPIQHLEVAWFGVPSDQLVEGIALVDRAHPKLRIDLISVNADRSPEAIAALAHTQHIPLHHVFLNASSSIDLRQLSGVRLIF